MSGRSEVICKGNRGASDRGRQKGILKEEDESKVRDIWE